MPTARQITQTEIDGVPTFWTLTPGPLTAVLVLRVGRADETLARAGISHLVEHLALAPLGQQAYDHNGQVDAITTAFYVGGSPDEVATFLGHVGGALDRLPLERLSLEREILRTEADGRTPSFADRMRGFRFGPRGHGLTGAPELGIGWLPAPIVDEWSRLAFSRGNAALCLSGAPPAGLRLPLPDGPRRPWPEIAIAPDMAPPIHAAWGDGGVSVSWVMRRDPAANMVTAIAERRLRATLRFERGLVYDVARAYEPLSADLAHVAIGADCPPERVPPVRDEMVATLRRLAEDGPTTDELQAEVDALARDLDNPGDRAGMAFSMAMDVLAGGAPLGPEELLDRRRGVTPDDARAALSTALETLLLWCAGPTPDGFAVYPPYSVAEVAGRTLKPAGFALPGRGRRERLVIGPDGVMWHDLDGNRLTVRFADCVAVQHFDGDVRVLWATDGARVAVEAAAWRNGKAAVAAIDAAVPRDLIACDEHGLGIEAETAAPAGRRA